MRIFFPLVLFILILLVVTAALQANSVKLVPISAQQLLQFDSTTSNLGSYLQNLWKYFVHDFYIEIIIYKRYLAILEGLKTTLYISMVSCFIGTILGSIICYLRLSKLRIAEVFAKTYVKIVGGIPELVLLLIFYYVVFARGHQSPLFMAITAFSLNFAARVSVIFQKSIETIDKRQPEAALTLGFNKFQTFLYVTLPQALRTILPLYQMRLINLVWWTSVVGYISVHDLTMAGRIVQQKTLDSFMPFLLVGVIYMLIAWFITYIISKFEFRLDPHKRRPSISVK